VDRRDWVILALGLILWAVTVRYAYDTGVEKGWWEHEAEENAYGCEVIKA